MVNLIENWEVLEEYAGDKQGFYQILDGEAETVSSRALTSLQAQKLMIKMGLPLEEVEEEPEVPLPVKKKLVYVLGKN